MVYLLPELMRAAAGLVFFAVTAAFVLLVGILVMSWGRD